MNTSTFVQTVMVSRPCILMTLVILCQRHMSLNSVTEFCYSHSCFPKGAIKWLCWSPNIASSSTIRRKEIRLSLKCLLYRFTSASAVLCVSSKTITHCLFEIHSTWCVCVKIRVWCNWQDWACIMNVLCSVHWHSCSCRSGIFCMFFNPLPVFALCLWCRQCQPWLSTTAKWEFNCRESWVSDQTTRLCSACSPGLKQMGSETTFLMLFLKTII